MNKFEFIDFVNNKVNEDENQDLKLNRMQVEKVLNIILDSMKQAMYETNELNIRSFGTFSVKTQKACVRRNPKTSERISVPEKKKLHFKVSPVLIGMLNDAPADDKE